jgi:class 3 adenylate cyclase
MTDPDANDLLRENARRILRAKRERVDHRAERKWPLEIAIGLVVVAVLAVAVFVIEARFF